MATEQSSNCQLSDAIQNLPPELREKILKAFIATKLRQRAALGWDKVHEHIAKLPFCQYMQKIVPMVICFEYANCRFEGCCFSCYESGTLHKVSLSPPMELIPPIETTAEYKNFLKVCSWDGYYWHELVPFWGGALAKKGGCFLIKHLIGIKHSSNDLARNIANIFLPLGCEIFVGEKRNQVETGDHVLIMWK